MGQGPINAHTYPLLVVGVVGLVGMLLAVLAPQRGAVYNSEQEEAH